MSLLPVALQTSSASSTPQRDWATQNFVPPPVTEKSNWMHELSLKVSVPQPSLHPGSRFRQCCAQTEPQLTQLGPNFPSNEVSYVARQCQPSVSSLHKSLSRAFPESTSRTTDINHSHRHPQTMAVCKRMSNSPVSSSWVSRPKFCFTLEVDPGGRQYDRDKIETPYSGRRLENVATALRVSVGFNTSNTVSVI